MHYKHPYEEISRKKNTSELIGFRTHFIGRPSFGSRRSLENDSVRWFYNLLFCCFLIGLFSCAFRHIIIYIWRLELFTGGAFFLFVASVLPGVYEIITRTLNYVVGDPTMWTISEANSIGAIGGIRKGKQVWSGWCIRSPEHTESPVESSITYTHSWTHSCCAGIVSQTWIIRWNSVCRVYGAILLLSICNFFFEPFSFV